MTTTDSGRSPGGSGYSAEPEPVSVVSAVPVSIPNAKHIALLRVAADYIDGLPMSASSAALIADNLRVFALSLEGSADA